MVRASLMRLLGVQEVGTLVASAACGADIIALEAASALSVRTCIVLPFDSPRFRLTSVIDRGEAWGPRFDAVMRAAELRHDVTVLPPEAGDDEAAYGQATARIIADSLALAEHDGTRAIAIAIWDGVAREDADATRDFITRALAADMEVISISTLG